MVKIFISIKNKKKLMLSLFLVLVFPLLAMGQAVSNSYNGLYHIGSTEEVELGHLIKKYKLSIGIRGENLPEGEAIFKGETDARFLPIKNLFYNKCGHCHGRTFKKAPLLIGREPALLKSQTKTVGNFWPWATTLFDYIRRAMPFDKPGSLTNEEVYKITLYILVKNKIIKEEDAPFTLNRKTLPLIHMPNCENFFLAKEDPPPLEELPKCPLIVTDK